MAQSPEAQFQAARAAQQSAAEHPPAGTPAPTANDQPGYQPAAPEQLGVASRSGGEARPGVAQQAGASSQSGVPPYPGVEQQAGVPQAPRGGVVGQAGVDQAGGKRPSNLVLAGAGSVLAVLAFLGGMAVGHSWDGSSNQQGQFGGPGGGRGFPGNGQGFGGQNRFGQNGTGQGNQQGSGTQQGGGNQQGTLPGNGTPQGTQGQTQTG